MNGFRSVILATLLVSGLSKPTFAQAPPPASTAQSELKKKFAEMSEKGSAPGEQHKALAAFVGDFDQISEVRMGPGEPMKANAIGKGHWTMGGRFVEFRSESARDEELKGERLLIYGYDPAIKKFTLYNLDSGSLVATTAIGEYDAASKTFTFEGEKDQPGAGKHPFRWVLKVQKSGEIDQQILVKMGERGFVPVVSVKHIPRAK